MKVTRELLDELTSACGSPCISIYLPTYRAGAETRQNPIRLKNALAKVEEQLEAGDHDAEAFEERLKPAHALLDDFEFWQHQTDGLALFIGPDAVRTHHLPMTVDEAVVLGDRPYVRPLLPLLGGAGRYALLALSRNKVRFFQGSRDGLQEVAVPGLPESIEDALGYETEPASIQAHSGGGPAGQRAVFHGQGGGEDDKTEETRNFVHRINAALGQRLNDQPVVIAAVERLAAAYRNNTDADTLVEGAVTGNPDEATAESLHEKAWPRVESMLTAPRDKAFEALGQAKADGKVCDDLAGIIRDASFGRVATVFLATDSEAWGTWDAGENRADVSDERQPGDRDLIEEAALQALRNGAEVYLVEADHLDEGQRAVATLRY